MWFRGEHARLHPGAETLQRAVVLLPVPRGDRYSEGAGDRSGAVVLLVRRPRRHGVRLGGGRRRIAIGGRWP